MNTCLSTIYLKICQFDSRSFRMLFALLTLVTAGGIVLGIPIHGDVGG